MYPEIAYLDEGGNFVVEEIKSTEAYSKYLSQKSQEKSSKGLKRLFRF